MTPQQELESLRLDPQGHTYDPRRVLRLAQEALKTTLPPAEVLNITEQAFLAALDAGQNKKAAGWLDKILKEFNAVPPALPAGSDKRLAGYSARALKLKGMLHEANGEWDEAMTLYQSGLEDDDTRIALFKRLISMHVAEGSTDRAIQALCVYLDTFMQDVEAWSYLAQLYLEEFMFQQAAFCYEEVMLLKPMYHLTYTRYADVQFSIKKYHMALKYYCRALELCKDHPRSLYGMRLAAGALLEGAKDGKDGKRGEDKTSGDGEAKAAGDAALTQRKGPKGKDGDREPETKVEKETMVDPEGLGPVSVTTLKHLHSVAGKQLQAIYQQGTTKDTGHVRSVVSEWIDQTKR